MKHYIQLLVQKNPTCTFFFFHLMLRKLTSPKIVMYVSSDWVCIQ